MNIIQTRPVYGRNYRLGYLGFEFKTADPIAEGIAWFTRQDRESAVKVAHVFIVSGPDECIEAHAGSGVIRASLEGRLADPCTIVCFKKPAGWSLDLGARIVAAAEPRIGEGYDGSLIVAHALNGSFLGRLVSHLTGDEIASKLVDLLDTQDEWICSELGAYVLNEQVEFAGVGVLSKPNASITPQELFDCDELFEPWKDKLPDRSLLYEPAKAGSKDGV